MPKNFRIDMRMDRETIDHLELLKKKAGVDRSKIIRNLIQLASRHPEILIDGFSFPNNISHNKITAI